MMISGYFYDRLALCLLFCAASLMLVSCCREAMTVDAFVRLSVSGQTRAEGGDMEMNDVSLFVYDGSGALSGVYRESGKDCTRVPMEYGKRYSIYALVNASGLPCDPVPDMKDDLGSFLIRDMSGAVLHNVMAGQSTVVVSDWRTEVVVPVRSVMARLDLRADFSHLEPGVDYSIEKVSIRQCCRSLPPFSRPEFSPESRSFDLDAIPDDMVRALNEGCTVPLFVPENRRGVLDAIVSPWNKTPSFISDVCSAPDTALNATYLEIHTQMRDTRSSDVQTRVVFRFYPGANNTSDFNLVRNTAYRIAFSPQLQPSGFTGNWKVGTLSCSSGIDFEMMDECNLNIFY